MAAPVMSHLICTSALIGLIFVMPYFYSIVIDNVETEMTIRELKEIADYVSNTLGNLYHLANSSDYNNVTIEKELIFLPTYVENSVYIIKIEATGGNVSSIIVYLKEKPSVSGSSWIAPGMKLGPQSNLLESGRTSLAGCSRNSTSVVVWIRYR